MSPNMDEYGWICKSRNQVVEVGAVSFTFTSDDPLGDFVLSVTTVCALKGPALQREFTFTSKYSKRPTEL